MKPPVKRKSWASIDRRQLAYLERHVQRERAAGLMKSVSLCRSGAPGRTGESTRQRCVHRLWRHLRRPGGTGGWSEDRPNVLIRDAVIKEQVEIFADSVIEDAVIGAGSRVGPFAAFAGDRTGGSCAYRQFCRGQEEPGRLRSKINHLSYVGDSVIGSQVNIGAGTITCNYDGANKHQNRHCRMPSLVRTSFVAW